MQTSTPLLAIALVASPLAARAADAPFSVQVQIGPVEGVPSATRTISFEQAARKQRRVFDVQDGRQHNVRGVALRALLAAASAPKAADTALVVYSDGMQIPVHLADKSEVDAVFIAFEHGDAMDRFTARYPLLGRQMELAEGVLDLALPGRALCDQARQLEGARGRARATDAAAAGSIGLAALPQTLPAVPRPGWAGGRARIRLPHRPRSLPPHPRQRGDRLGRAPQPAREGEGLVDGTMPVLDHVSSAEIATLWKWLHAVHRGATK
jgi:hypothetical protein